MKVLGYLAVGYCIGSIGFSLYLVLKAPYHYYPSHEAAQHDLDNDTVKWR